MVTILLEKILTLLTGWLDAFNEHAGNVLAKLNLIEEDTSNLPDIKNNTADIKDNTASVITPINNISSNTSSIKTNTDSIKADTTIIKNNINTISTNTGSTSAYCQDIATNTLDIKDKVVTIASDTTQIRTNTNNVLTDLDKVYEALKWSLVDKITTETVEGTNAVSFNTDLTNDLVDLEVDIEATQSGSGTPSPTNVRPIVGHSDKSILINGNNITISLGQTVYCGVLNVVSGLLKITHVVISKNISDMNNSDAYPGWRNSGIRSIIGAGIDGNVSTLVNIGSTYSFNTKSTNDIIYLSRGDYNRTQSEWISEFPSLTVEMLVKYATPLEIALTPSQIATIKGDNTIVTDGDMKVTYEESIKHYLDKQ